MRKNDIPSAYENYLQRCQESGLLKMNKKASVRAAANTVDEKILDLCERLRVAGLHKMAQEIETNFVQYQGLSSMLEALISQNMGEIHHPTVTQLEGLSEHAKVFSPAEKQRQTAEKVLKNPLNKAASFITGDLTKAAQWNTRIPKVPDLVPSASQVLSKVPGASSGVGSKLLGAVSKFGPIAMAVTTWLSVATEAKGLYDDWYNLDNILVNLDKSIKALGKIDAPGAQDKLASIVEELKQIPGNLEAAKKNAYVQLKTKDGLNALADSINKFSDASKTIKTCYNLVDNINKTTVDMGGSDAKLLGEYRDTTGTLFGNPITAAIANLAYTNSKVVEISKNMAKIYARLRAEYQAELDKTEATPENQKIRSDETERQRKVIDDMNKQKTVVKSENDYDVMKAGIRQQLTDMKAGLAEIAKSNDEQIKEWANSSAGPFLVNLESQNDKFNGSAGQDAEFKSFYNRVQKADASVKKAVNKIRNNKS